MTLWNIASNYQLKTPNRFFMKGKTMTYRITVKDLENGIGRLNRLAGTPQTPYTKNKAGKFIANAGNYHLSGAYGGYMVQQMCNEGTGCTTPITADHVPKRECYETLHAFINGFEASGRK
jgi:hypothetical protein